MGRGFRIGRLFGIDITVDASWLFIFLLLSWNLTSVFGRWHPDWHPLLSLGLAVVAALLFFASVLVHELAHALVAMAHGVPVHSITLFLFGGVSNLEREPPSPRAEFLTAIVGPIASILLGVAFGLLASAATHLTLADDAEQTMASLGPIATLLVWLGPVNVTVGVFNLVPAFPLDGGRVLRALLWKTTGDVQKATRWAARVGQVIGWTFIAMGIAMVFGMRVPFFGGGIVGGMWLAFIGWFLTSAAQRSYAGMLVQDVLGGVRVARLMRRTFYAVPVTTSLATLVNDWFLRSAEQSFPVAWGDRIVGVVTLAAVRRVPQEEWASTGVSSVMTPLAQLATVRDDDEVVLALRRLAESNSEQLPVMDRAGAVVGIIDRRDIARYIELHVDRTLRPRGAHG